MLEKNGHQTFAMLANDFGHSQPSPYFGRIVEPRTTEARNHRPTRCLQQHDMLSVQSDVMSHNRGQSIVLHVYIFLLTVPSDTYVFVYSVPEPSRQYFPTRRSAVAKPSPQ